VIASLSWRFVEQPFRKGRFRPRRRLMLGITGTTVGLISCASVILVWFDGFPGRFPQAARQVAAYADYDRTSSTREGVCFLVGYNKLEDFRQDLCFARHPGRKSILLLGDSHAAQLLAGLLDAFPDRDILQANFANCPPLIPRASQSSGACRDFNSLIFDRYLATHQVDSVILCARWSPKNIDPLKKTIDSLREKGIIPLVVGPAVEYDQALPRILALAIRDGYPGRVAAHQVPEPRQLDIDMAKAALRWHVPYLSMFRDLCTPECLLYSDAGSPILFDNNHFTAQGSILFVRRMIASGELR